MGQAKHNPIAIAAKKGELPPKKPRLGRRERDQIIAAAVMDRLSIPPLKIMSYMDSGHLRRGTGR